MDNRSKEDIKKRIDADSSLNGKRRLLTITSLILLAIQLSGAKIEEANTFIFKIVFESHGGLAQFLLLAIIFLLIRYYGYARQYHDELYELWSKRMLSDKYYFYDPHQMEAFGLIVELCPEQLHFERGYDDERFRWDYHYVSLFPLRRFFLYEWSDENDDCQEKVSLFKCSKSPVQYLGILLNEFRYRVHGLFAYRENLDILAPYLTAALAIASFYFNKPFKEIISLIIPT